MMKWFKKQQMIRKSRIISAIRPKVTEAISITKDEIGISRKDRAGISASDDDSSIFRFGSLDQRQKARQRITSQGSTQEGEGK